MADQPDHLLSGEKWKERQRGEKERDGVFWNHCLVIEFAEVVVAFH